MAASKPLRLIDNSHISNEHVACVSVASLGGGVVRSNESVNLDVHVSHGATAHISSLRSSKLIRRVNSNTAPSCHTEDLPTQSTIMSVAEGGFLVHTPAPTSCTLKGDADILKSYHLSRGSSLVAVDMFTRSQLTQSSNQTKASTPSTTSLSTSFEDDYMIGHDYKRDDSDNEKCSGRVGGRARLYSDSDMDTVNVRSRLQLFSEDDLVFEDMFDLSSSHSFTSNMKVRGLIIIAGPRALPIRHHAEKLIQTALITGTPSSFRYSLANPTSIHGSHTIHAIASASSINCADGSALVIRFTTPTVDDSRTFVYSLLHPLETHLGITLDSVTVRQDAELKVFYVPPPTLPRTLPLSHPSSFPLVRFQSFNTLDSLERDSVKRCPSDSNLAGKRVAV